MAAYSKKQLDQILTFASQIKEQANNLMMEFTWRTYKSEKAKEFATHGFSRRIRILSACVDNLFAVLPPSIDTVPDKTSLDLATINLQAFIFNTYGCLDNLAWVWKYEKELEIAPRHIGLGPKCESLRASLSQNFLEQLATFDKWFEYLEDYRHALAHRIPLYIPPGQLSKNKLREYEELSGQIDEAFKRLDIDTYERLDQRRGSMFTFSPLMTHSYSDQSHPVFFHAQMIADFLTVESIAFSMLNELKSV